MAGWQRDRLRRTGGGFRPASGALRQRTRREPRLREVPDTSARSGVRPEGGRPRADDHPHAEPTDDQHRDLELHRRGRRPHQPEQRPHHQEPARLGHLVHLRPWRRGAASTTAYAAQKKVCKVGGTVTINAKAYKIVGLVSPTLTGNVSDIYFDLSTLQKDSRPSLAGQRGPRLGRQELLRTSPRSPPRSKRHSRARPSSPRRRSPTR